MIMNFLQYINTFFHQLFGKNFNEAVGTIILLITFTIVYSLIVFWVKKRNWSIDKKRRRSINARNSLVLLLIISIIFIWSGEIKTMILSITALAAAIIIAFKEMILCFLGSLFITSNKLFSLGEYIEIDGIRGKVIDKNFVYTKIIISEPFQTREMNIPNIFFVTNKMVNLSHYGKFQSYTLKLAVPNFIMVKKYVSIIEKLATEVIGKHQETYSEYFNGKKLTDIFFDIPKNYYSIEYDLADNRNAVIKFHYLAHPLQQEEIEQLILKGYSERIYEEYLELSKKEKNEDPQIQLYYK